VVVGAGVTWVDLDCPLKVPPCSGAFVDFLQEEAEVEVGFGVLGFDIDSLFVVVFGFVELRLANVGAVFFYPVTPGEEFAEAVVDVSITGADFGCCLVIPAGEFKLTRRVQDAAKVVIGFGVVLVDLGGLR
jgi:hypothetical protein